MNDHNILNAANFDDMQKTFTVQVQPFIHDGGGTLDLGGMHNVFWVKHIGWEYKYIDVGYPNAKRKPIKRIEVSVSDNRKFILDKATRALPPFTEPRPIVGSIPFQVINTNLDNNHKLQVDFHIRGVLVSPRDGHEPLSLKKQKGYVMMDSNQRGLLAMDEDAADQLDETFIRLGLGSLRDSLPGGFHALKGLPAPLQNAVIAGLINKGELPNLATMLPGTPAFGAPPTLALPDADPEKESSAFVGDMLLACPEDCQDVVVKHLKNIAEVMIEKGWRRV